MEPQKKALSESARKEAKKLEKMLRIPDVDYAVSNCLNEVTAVSLKRYFGGAYSVEMRATCLDDVSGHGDRPYHLMIRKIKAG